MDLSNLRTSLEGLDESNSRRRGAVLRNAEEELNSHFRSSALQLTTLYRQAVTSSKTSYEKGYAHALAHVLELWDTDRDWLRGYIQRRIEAVEAEQDDETDEPLPAPPRETPTHEVDDTDRQLRAHSVGPFASALASRKTSRLPTPITTRETAPSPTTLKTGSKRTRSTDVSRKPARRPIPPTTTTTTATNTSASPSSSTASSGGLPFSSSFDFSVPTSLSMTPLDPTLDSHKRNKYSSCTSGSSSMPIIKISTPASQRQRLRNRGLRADIHDRILEINHQHPSLSFNSSSNDMQDDDENASQHYLAYHDDKEAWTDDDDDDQPNSSSPAMQDLATVPLRSAKTTWTDKTPTPNQASSHAQLTPPPHHHTPQDAQRILERIDRRKRRRSALHPDHPHSQHSSPPRLN